MSSSKYCFPVAGMVLIVALRLAIGWQFLYEGLWKINSLSTPTPWTAEGYLKNSAGPLRGTFRDMTGDANDYNWLDADKVAAKWDVWQQAFVDHYGLDEKQQARLNDMINGPKEFKVALKQLPAGVTIPKSLAKVVRFDEKAGRLICSGESHMLYAEREQLLKLAPGDDDASKAYRKAVTDLHKAASKLSYKEKLRASLIGDPDRAGLIQEQYKDTIDYHRLGEIEKYKLDVARYEANLAAAKVDFNYKHLERQWGELQALRAKVTGPIKAMDKELKTDARDKLLNSEQLSMGPPTLPKEKIDWINLQTIAGLTILGGLLIAGLLTRPAAVAGAGMLLMFYLAMPPWPGVPEAPGPEHSFIINKNLIEVLALLAIAALPTGQWFGLDGLLTRLCCRRKSCEAGTCSTAACNPAPVSAPTPTPAPAK